jgi:hypothetical protein
MSSRDIARKLRLTQPSFLEILQDKRVLHLEAVFNVYSSNLCARDNPHANRELGYQVRYSVRIWTQIIGDIVVGPYQLPDRLTAQRCDFVEAVQPGLPEAVPLAVGQSL